jgi:hypothetical protein
LVDKVKIIKANAEPNQQQGQQFRNKLPPGLRKSKEIQGLTGSSSIKILTKSAGRPNRQTKNGTISSKNS